MTVRCAAAARLEEGRRLHATPEKTRTKCHVLKECQRRTRGGGDALVVAQGESCARRSRVGGLARVLFLTASLVFVSDGLARVLFLTSRSSFVSDGLARVLSLTVSLVFCF